MSGAIRIAEFLEQRIYTGAAPASLRALDAFAGKQVTYTRFATTLEDAHALLLPWMPLYYLPVGEHGGFHIGVHLRPLDVAAGRVAILQARDSMTMAEISGSPEHLVFLSLVRKEGAVRGAPPPEFLEHVKIAQDVLGAGFYKPGSYGEFGDDEAQDVAAREMAPSAQYFLTAALFESDLNAKLDLLEKGIKMDPGCMGFYTRAVKAHLERGEMPQAAAKCARSLQCYHHTSYGEDLEEYYETARGLAAQFPGEFSDLDRRDLATTGDKPRLTWITELYQAGQVEAATKVLCDMCHALEDYDSVLHIFRKHFEKLAWPWALALCDFRSGAVL